MATLQDHARKIERTAAQQAERRIHDRSQALDQHQEVELMIEALGQLQNAIKILEPIAHNTANRHSEDIADVIKSIRTIISCDEGEAGLDPLISRIVERIAPVE